MQSYFFMVVYFILNIGDFKYAEMIYHFMLEDLLKQNERAISSVRTSVYDWYTANIGFWWDYFKRTVVGTLAAMSGLLPARVQPFISGMVQRANQYATGTGMTEDDRTESSDAISLDTPDTE